MSKRRETTRFAAKAVAATRVEGADVVIVAENEDGSGRRLEISASVEATSQDRVLGQDTYCLVDDSGVTHYGGVTDWALEGEVLRLTLGADGADLFGRAGWVIRLAVCAADRTKLGEALRRLLSA